MNGNLRRHAAEIAAHGQSLWYDGYALVKAAAEAVRGKMEIG